MQTFEIDNGDFVLSGGTFSTISGRAKIEQDLKVATLTPYGSDRFHPRFGSVFSQYLGNPIGQSTQALIRSEMTRIISQYQQVQMGSMNAYTINGQQPPYSDDDVVAAIASVTVNQSYDTFEVSAQVTTLAGQSAVISASVSPNSLTASS